MPVYKIPIVHKFGIISHSQRVELQKHILDQARRKSQKSSLGQKSNPFQVSEEFVQKYNVANVEEKEVLHNKAEQLLCRSKRRCGLETCGEGDHVDLPLAWSELAILAQCKGKVQENCLDILSRSLNEAPLHEENVPTLFFLAESALYWLHVDAMKQPYLRSAEIKLLKMGQLVFIRLLYHHLSGHMRGLADLKTRLSSYIDAVKNQQSLYQSYPGVLMCFQTILSVAEVVIGPYTVYKPVTEDEDAEQTEAAPALAACVYRALRVWKIAAVTKIGLKKAVLSLLEAVYEMSNSKEWLNGFLALGLLSEAAKVNLDVCKLMQSIACGKTPKATPNGAPDPKSFPSVSPRLPGPQEEKVTSSGERNSSRRHRDKSLSELTRRASSSIEINKESSSQKQAPQENKPISQPQTNSYVLGLGGWEWKNSYQYSLLLTDICLNGATSEIQKAALMGKWGDADVTTFRAGIPNPCLESCGLADLLEYSGPLPREKITTQEKANDWSWMVRYGALSGLNKLAHTLHGNKEKIGLRSAAWSLITAIQDCASTDKSVLEALRVSQLEFPNSPRHRESVSIWSRVAQHLSEVYLLPPSTPRPPSSLMKTPSKSPRSQAASPIKTIPKPVINIKRPTLGEEVLIHTAAVKDNPDFTLRTSLDLKRLVADQWRKDMINEQKGKEENRILQMEKKRIEVEEKHDHMLQTRKEKLKGRPTAALGPYQLAK